MSANPESVTGEFHSSVPRNNAAAASGPASHNKIQEDAKPEFHVEVLPAGSAPSDKTHKPHPTAESIATYAPEMTGSDAQEVPKELKGQQGDHDHAQAKKDEGEGKGLGDGREFSGAEEKVPQTAAQTF